MQVSYICISACYDCSFRVMNVPDSALNDKRNNECVMFSRSLLQSPLGFHNYAERFDLLLYLEECQMHVDIKRYNKDQVTLLKDHDKRLLGLHVSGNVFC